MKKIFSFLIFEIMLFGVLSESVFGQWTPTHPFRGLSLDLNNTVFFASRPMVPVGEMITMQDLQPEPRLLWKPFDPATMGVQMLTWVGGAATVGLVAVPVANAVIPPGGDLRGLGVLLLAGTAGVVLGPPIGVYFGGKWMGGDGTFGATFLGSLLASGFAFSTMYMDRPLQDSMIVPAIVSLFAGPILGYHLSANSVYAEVLRINGDETRSFGNSSETNLRPPGPRLVLLVVSVGF